MNKREIYHLRDTVRKGIYNRSDILWQKAFKEYNEDNKYKKNLNCGHCYKLIYIYINQKYQNREESSGLAIIQ